MFFSWERPQHQAEKNPLQAGHVGQIQEQSVPGSPMLQARRHIHPAPFVWANAQRGQRGRRRPRKEFSMKKPLQILLD